MIVYTKKSQVPLDRGYAWVILVASFGCLFIASLPFINGIFQVVFTEVFQQDAFTTSWILSVSNSLGCMGGPLASFLFDRIGSRLTVIVGGLMGSIGFVCSAYSYSYLQLAISYGLLVGLGVAIVYTPCSVAVGFYFERYRNVSFGIINIAVGLCIMVMAPLVTATNEYYGWRGTMLILAGLYLQTVWLGCLLRPVLLEPEDVELNQSPTECRDPPEEHAANKEPAQLATLMDEEDEEDDVPDEMLQFEVAPRKGRSVTVSVMTRQKSRSISETSAPGDPDRRKSSGSRVTLTSIGSSLSWGSRHVPGVVAGPDGSILDLQRAAETSSTEGGGSLAGVSRHRSSSMRRVSSWNSRTSSSSTVPAAAAAGEILPRRPSFKLRPRSISETIHESHAPEEMEMLEAGEAAEKRIANGGGGGGGGGGGPEIKRQKRSRRIRDVILPPALLRNRSYMTYMCVALFINLGNSTGYQHFLGYAKSYGTSPDACALLLSLTGVANMLSRFLSGLVANGDPFPLRVIHFATIGITGLLFLLAPLLIQTYVGQVAFSLGFGFYANCFIPVIGSIIIQFVGLEYLSTAFGLLIFFHGLGNLLGPPIAGRIYDVTNSYGYSFVLGGLFYLAGSMLMMTTSLDIGRKGTDTDQKEKTAKDSKPS